MLKIPLAIKILIITILVSVIASVAVYTAMLADTNSVISYAESVFRGEVPLSETAGQPVDMYNINHYLNGSSDTVEVNLKITRRFVLHDFFDGYIWATYTDDSSVGKGDCQIPSRWKIHKTNGQWQIVAIKEKP